MLFLIPYPHSCSHCKSNAVYICHRQGSFCTLHTVHSCMYTCTHLYTEPNQSNQGKLFTQKKSSLHKSLSFFFSVILALTFRPSASLFILLLPPFTPPPSWYSLLVKHLGVGVIGAGRPKEDQQRKGCSCCGLAACFIIILLPACLEFGAHWLSCKVRNHNFLKNV